MKDSDTGIWVLEDNKGGVDDEKVILDSKRWDFYMDHKKC